MSVVMWLARLIYLFSTPSSFNKSLWLINLHHYQHHSQMGKQTAAILLYLPGSVGPTVTLCANSCSEGHVKWKLLTLNWTWKTKIKSWISVSWTPISWTPWICKSHIEVPTASSFSIFTLLSQIFLVFSQSPRSSRLQGLTVFTFL